MELSRVSQLIEGQIVHASSTPHLFEYTFASDLMSDILRATRNETSMMITGLATVQAIRTAEMAGISCVILARDKKVTDDMLQLAVENDISLIASPLTLFEISGRLYNNGIKPVY